MTLSEEDIRYLDSRFVTVKDCETKTDKNQADIASMKADFREMKAKVNMLIGILAAIAAPVLAIAIKLLFGGK